MYDNKNSDNNDSLMKNLYLAASINIVLALITAIAYLSLSWKATTNSLPAYTTLLLEAFKTLLTFSLITVGGVIVKGVIDKVLENERNRQIKANQNEETRRTILKEFADIYSAFYSIRKLYHSALSNGNDIYDTDSEDFKKLVRDILRQSVELEGRYGALKVLAITHFDLKRGDFGYKEVPELISQIALSTNIHHQKRLQLDLLGEYYDDWRHALEQKRKINVDNEFFKEYAMLLEFFEEDKAHSLQNLLS